MVMGVFFKVYKNDFAFFMEMFYKFWGICFTCFKGCFICFEGYVLYVLNMFYMFIGTICIYWGILQGQFKIITSDFHIALRLLIKLI